MIGENYEYSYFLFKTKNFKEDKKMSKEKQKAEALKRMKYLKVFPEAIRLFEEKGTVMVSEGGILFEANEEQKKMISSFERQFEGLVYMIIHNNTEIGELYSLLYVCREEKEWRMDWDDIAEDYTIAAVLNKDFPIQSFELGSIGIANRFGGLVRTE